MTSRFLSALAALALFCAGITHAQVPRTINYQGYLTSPSGTATSASLPMVFKIYSVVSGGAALHTEPQTIAVTNGIFNVLLGSGVSLTLPFDTQYYLGVTVGADGEMVPRQPLAASPYSLRAASAEALAASAVVPGSQIAASSVAASKLASSGCTSGQVLQYNGSAWVCATPAASSGGTVTSITAGGGLTGGTITGSGTIALASGLTLAGTTTGSFSGPLTGNVTGSASNFSGALAGDVTGTQGATSISATTVTGKALTGFVSGAGTLSTSDTLLNAINKLDGNVALKSPLASPKFTGAVGIGTNGSGSPLTVAGVIETTGVGSGGIKFPDGTVQTTASVNPVVEFASFFGMSAGPGNTGINDYPATIQISAPGPSVASGSALNFPRASAPAVGGIVINNPGPSQSNNTEFILPSVGTYRVTWHISVDEPAQMSLWINSGPAFPGGMFIELRTASGAPSNVGQSIGSTQLVGDVIFRNTVANSAIQIRNFASPSSLSITPQPGGTRAQAVSLIIQRLQ